MRTSLSEDIICQPRFATSANAFLYAASGAIRGKGALVVNYFPLKKLPDTAKFFSHAGAFALLGCLGVAPACEFGEVEVVLSGSTAFLLGRALSDTFWATLATVSQPEISPARTATDAMKLRRRKIVFISVLGFKLNYLCLLECSWPSCQTILVYQ